MSAPRRVIGSLLFALLGGCAHRPPGAGSPPSIGAPQVTMSAPACAALAVVLDSLAAGQRGEYPLLADATIAYGSSKYVPEFFRRVRATPGLRDDTWTSFLARNEAPERVCPVLPGQGTAVTTASPLAPWATIAAAHPKATGLYLPSSAGVSPDGNQVLFVVRMRSSPCGSSRLVALVDRDAGARWRITSLFDDGVVGDCLVPLGKPPGS